MNKIKSDTLKILRNDVVIYRDNKRLTIFPLSKDERNFLLELKRVFNLDCIAVTEENAKD